MVEDAKKLVECRRHKVDMMYDGGGLVKTCRLVNTVMPQFLIETTARLMALVKHAPNGSVESKCFFFLSF